MVAAVAALVTSLIGAGWAIRNPPAKSGTETGQTALPVATMRVQAESAYTSVRSFTGVLKAARTSQLSFERPGLVVAVLVDQGERVEAGETLAQLDRRHLEARGDQLLAQRSEAQARLDELVAGPRREQIGAAKAEVQNLEAQVELLRRNAERRQVLLDSSSTSLEDYESSKLNHQSMQAQLEAARQLHNELASGTRQEQIEAARAAVKQLDAAISLNNHDLDDCTLEAPFAGTVSERFVDEGTVVEPGAPILRIVESDRLEAWIGVPVDVAARLELGQEQLLVVDGAELCAKVAAILPEVDLPTRTRRVVLALDRSTADALVPGQVVRLETEVETAADGFWLPTAALTRGERGLWSCFAVAPHPEREAESRVEPRTLEVLYASGDRAFVRGTLSDGDLVIASGTHRVVASQTVRPVASQNTGGFGDSGI